MKWSKRNSIKIMSLTLNLLIFNLNFCLTLFRIKEENTLIIVLLINIYWEIRIKHNRAPWGSQMKKVIHRHSLLEMKIKNWLWMKKMSTGLNKDSSKIKKKKSRKFNQKIKRHKKNLKYSMTWTFLGNLRKWNPRKTLKQSVKRNKLRNWLAWCSFNNKITIYSKKFRLKKK